MTDRALYRVNFDVCQRSRGGDAVKLAAYNACTRLVHDGRVYDFRRKQSEHVGRTLLLAPAGFPASAFRSPGDLWRAAEAAENRGNSQTARQILITIPREVPPERRLDFIRHVVSPMQQAGMALQVDIHDPGARDGSGQPHAHVLATMREFGDGGFSKTKARGRDWNRLFTENSGREMRGRIAERMNAWFESGGFACRVDARRNADIDGPDATPPEPIVSRSAIEIEKRQPGKSDQVRRLDLHRLHRRAVQEIDAEIANAEAKSAVIKRRISRRQEQEKGSRKMTIPWVKEQGELSPKQIASAKDSYAKWRDAQLKRGRDEDRIFGFDAYVDYVRDRKRDEVDVPHPLDNRQAAFAKTTYRDREEGFSRRNRFLANLLAEHYATEELDPAVAAGIKRIKLDRQAKTATVYLRDGTSFIDHGNSIEFIGRISQPSATEIAAAAQRHGWVNVTLTGTSDFRDETAIALALLEPPIAHDHSLSPAAARLATLQAAKNSIQNGTEDENGDNINSNSVAPVSAGGADIGSADTLNAHDGPDVRYVLAASAGRFDGLGAVDTGHHSAESGARAAGDGGIGDASDDDIMPVLMRFYEPRVRDANALLAARPKALSGTSRSARRSQQFQADFDSDTAAVRARHILATADALNDPARAPALIDAVRRTGNMSAAEDELRQQQQAERQRQAEPEPDEPEPSAFRM